jgi:para-aminobenzoate synthetase component 1
MNPKEAAELTMIVDLLRNDLGQIASVGSVRVKEHRNIQQLPSVWHTYSALEARLMPGLAAIDVLRAMLPGGSVTGCPKHRALELIDRIEKVRRGPYTGSIVMLSDDGSLESSVAIRMAVARGKHFRIGVGGGIVRDSREPEEYEETLRKAAPFTALEQGQEWFWVDGKRVPPSDRRLKDLDVDSPHSRGVMDTMIVDHGKLRFVSDHLSRLKHSWTLLGVRAPGVWPAIRQVLRSIATQAPWEMTRLRIVYTRKHMLVRAIELVVDLAERNGSSVIVRRLDRRIPGAKLLPYHREGIVHNAALQSGFHESLITDRLGRVTEASCSNIFWVENGVLYTPGENMLPGITRKIVLRIARRHRIPVAFALPTVKRLKNADEVFLTRTTIGVAPVIRIEGVRICDGKPGKLTLFFQAAYEREARKAKSG